MNQIDLQIKFERRFVLPALPEPLTRASEHWQFFDNHLTDTRLLLRRIRVPQTKKWTRKFVQKYALSPPDVSRTANAEIELNEYEYEVLSVFEGNELRYNRYFLPLENGETMLIDWILNRELWALIVATVEFETESAMRNFQPPTFVLKEITQDESFTNARLVDSNLEAIRQRFSVEQKISS